MRHRLRWIVLALVVLVVAGAVALVVFEKPTLDDDRTAVDARWAALRKPLVVRYQRLDDALGAFVAAGGGERTIARDLQADLAAWKRALSRDDPGTQVPIANRLEGEGVRLAANVKAAPRLEGLADLNAKLTAFAGSAPPSPLVHAYNRAARTYESDRTDTLRVPVARVFGFDARPLFALGAAPAP
ncbi:MAG TPA: hypothetical protein VEP49_12570 [Acidimicrobiia bacterium]|nr:hypothetical protein [Acidimicrobiia bacterium]